MEIRTFRYGLFMILMIIIIIEVVLLVPLSPDYENYSSTLTLAPSEYNFVSMEPAYWLIVYIVQQFFNSQPFALYFIFSILTFMIASIAYDDSSPYPFFSILLFFLLLYPNHGLIQIRQGLACSIWLYSLKYVVNGDWKKYFLFVSLAVLFHYSSIILYFIYFIDSKKINKPVYLLMPLVAVLLSYIISLDFLDSVAKILPFPFNIKLMSYISSMEIEGQSSRVNRVNVVNLVSVTMIALYYISLLMVSVSKVRKLKEYYIIHVKLLTFAILSFIALRNLPVLSFRLNVFFQCSIPVIVSFVISSIVREKELRVSLFALSLLYFSFLSWNIYIRHELFKIL